MENEKDLKELITNLVTYEKKISSVWWSFLRGIASGLGFFIGSAIVAAILIYVLTVLFRNSPLSGQFQSLMDAVNTIKQ